MKIVFVIQGEGRGHLSQALALKELIADGSHTLVAAFVGKCEDRTVPSYFVEKIGGPVLRYESPNLIKDSSNRGVDYWRSTSFNIRRRKDFLSHINYLHRQVTRFAPDLVINFYEPLWGLHELYYGGSPFVTISLAHQYLYDHPSVSWMGLPRTKRVGLRALNGLTAAGSRARLALSYQRLPDHGDMFVVPPLLRSSVLQRQPRRGKHLCVYLLNHGYADELLAWHRAHDHIELECFWDRHHIPDGYSPQTNITFRHLSDDGFITSMATASGVLINSGFESVCEALYLGKNVQVVPVSGHLEQQCNARDAQRAGAIVVGSDFIPAPSLLDTPEENARSDFKQWVDSARNIIPSLLEQLAESRKRAPIRRTITKATQLWLE